MDNSINIEHKLFFTMIDGKTFNVLADNSSSMRCYICNAKPVEMNNLNLRHSKVVNDEFYSFGLSSLHAWIRCFECLLHISYNMSFKKWSARSQSEKDMRENKKREVQNKFRTILGLNVDVVK